VAQKWHSSTHPISDIRDWNKAGNLIIQPDYQRREVWGQAAKVMLIDSILSGIPMPKIFVSSHIKDDRTIRTVIDGQQRINSILGFLGDAFPLDAPYEGQYLGKKFSDLPQDVRNELVLSYEIDFNEAKGLSEEELREVYSRVNKYLVALNRQELRKADFPGAFQQTAEDLANDDFFEVAGIFTAAARRRSLDVEFVSELLSAIMLGVTDRKDAIDQCYQQYKEWDEAEKQAKRNEFSKILQDVATIFGHEFVALRKTRWKQKADFYSFFMAVLELRREGLSLPEDLSFLRSDLKCLDENIAPTSVINILSEYAVYCVSQANSAASRKWRTGFLKGILRGTYARNLNDVDQRGVVFNVAADIRYSIDPKGTTEGCAPVDASTCPICGKLEEGTDLRAAALVWIAGTKAYQFSNARWAHLACCSNEEGFVKILPTEFVDAEEDDA
jgi:hypothetical protein